MRIVVRGKSQYTSNSPQLCNSRCPYYSINDGYCNKKGDILCLFTKMKNENPGTALFTIQIFKVTKSAKLNEASQKKEKLKNGSAIFLCNSSRQAKFLLPHSANIISKTARCV